MQETEKTPEELTAEMMAEADVAIEEARQRRLPRWMRAAEPEHRLNAAERRERRVENQGRKRLRTQVRRRRRHGRPVGR